MYYRSPFVLTPCHPKISRLKIVPLKAKLVDAPSFAGATACRCEGSPLLIVMLLQLAVCLYVKKKIAKRAFRKDRLAHQYR